MAAIDWLGEQAETKDLPVAVFGASTGAAAALVAAAERPPCVFAVVSRGGRPDLAGDALEQVCAPVLLLVGGRDREVLRLNEEAAVQVLLARGAAADITVAASHGLLVGDARSRLARLPLRRLLVTDTLATEKTHEPPLQVRSVASLLADAIDRLQSDRPLDALLMRS